MTVKNVKAKKKEIVRLQLPIVPYATKGMRFRFDFSNTLQKMVNDGVKLDRVIMAYLVLCRMQDHTNNTTDVYESELIDIEVGHVCFLKSYFVFNQEHRQCYEMVTGRTTDTDKAIQLRTQRAIADLIEYKLIERIKQTYMKNVAKVNIYKLTMYDRQHSQTINNSIFFARTAKTMRVLMDYCQININAVTDAEGELVPEKVGDAICDIIDDQRDTITRQRAQIEQLTATLDDVTADNAALAALMNGETDGAH